MTIKAKLNGIMSLSAASMALLGINSAEGDPSIAESNGKSDIPDKGGVLLKTNHLILAPPHQDKMLQLYAAHSSHVSHASHYSGAGGMGGDDYAPPAPYTPPPAPVYPYYPPQRRVPAQPAVPPDNSNTDGNASATNVVRPMTLKERAARGSDNSQCQLAFDYLSGDNGVETNNEKANLLFEFAAMQGNTVAKEKFAELAAKVQPQADTNTVPHTGTDSTNAPGTTISTNAAQIATLKERSAKGSDTAQCLLAFDYLIGSDGVEKSLQRATLLFELAALQSNDLAKAKFDQLNQKAKEVEQDQR
jgi:hypothetical protein